MGPLTTEQSERTAATILTALGGSVDHVATVRGEPLPKARARAGKSGHYTPRRTRDAQTCLAYALGARVGRYDTGNVAVCCIFYRKDRGVVDGDNLLKLVLDAAMEARLLRDDSQVTAQAAIVELDRLMPRTVVAIGRHESSMTR